MNISIAVLISTLALFFLPIAAKSDETHKIDFIEDTGAFCGITLASNKGKNPKVIAIPEGGIYMKIDSSPVTFKKVVSKSQLPSNLNTLKLGARRVDKFESIQTKTRPCNYKLRSQRLHCCFRRCDDYQYRRME